MVFLCIYVVYTRPWRLVTNYTVRGNLYNIIYFTWYISGHKMYVVPYGISRLENVHVHDEDGVQVLVVLGGPHNVRKLEELKMECGEHEHDR
jgi:hypothetical protein